MEPNEMVRYDLVGEYDLDIAPQADGDYVHYSEAMQVITALQSQIDGMIERPTISIRVLEREAFATRYLLRLNEFPIDGFYTLDSAEASGKLLIKALGMDVANPKEPQ